MLEHSIKIATKAHKGQKDKAGIDYIHHPLKVAELLETEKEKIVAMLHDVVEDTDTTLEDLKIEGFSEEILLAIDSITRRVGEDKSSYYDRILRNSLAIKVKIADLTHNSDITRILNPTERDYKRCQTYLNSLEFLRENLKKV